MDCSPRKAMSPRRSRAIGLLALAAATDAFSPGGASLPRYAASRACAAMFTDGSTSPGLEDRTRIGSLDVPQVALGTISWVPKSPLDAERIAYTARIARGLGLDFVDTVRLRCDAVPVGGVMREPHAFGDAGRTLRRERRVPHPRRPLQ